jgi:hypothetical protein
MNGPPISVEHEREIPAPLDFRRIDATIRNLRVARPFSKGIGFVNSDPQLWLSGLLENGTASGVFFS